MLLLHAWSILWGVDGWHDVSTRPHAYPVRHLGVVVIGLVGLAAWRGGSGGTGYWRWGLVAAAVLVAVPMWTGHTMFNVKDVPVATGHTLCTLGSSSSCATPAPRPLRVGRAGGTDRGVVLTLGTRPGMWSGLTPPFRRRPGGGALGAGARGRPLSPWPSCWRLRRRGGRAGRELPERLRVTAAVPCPGPARPRRTS